MLDGRRKRLHNTGKNRLSTEDYFLDSNSITAARNVVQSALN